jgi:membrane-associated protease RseP (regulator of RpoE activity)
VSKFETIKNEVVSGGSVAQAPPEKADPVTTVIGLGAWLALFVVLALANLWFLVFVVGILISVFLHEVGHYWTARRSGMKVTQFFIGFGPRVWSFHRNGIEYGLRAIPVGAFVKIIGMTSIDEIPVEDEPVTYRAASFPKRMWVITAGSAMHMIIAILVITAVYSTWGSVEQQGFVEISALTEALTEGDTESPTPAVQSGLQVDDVIRTVDGVAVSRSDALIDVLGAKTVGSTVVLGIERNGVPQDIAVTTVQHPSYDEARSFVGISSNSVDRFRQPFGEAVGDGAVDLVSGVGQAIKGVVKVINPVNVWGHLTNTSDDPTSRPTTLVGATDLSNDVGAFDGWAGVLSLLASLNVSVGVFNMFPLLPLDGGHAAVAAYERVRSRRGRRYYADVSKLMPLVAATVAVLGFMFLTGLYLDIVRPLP